NWLPAVRLRIPPVGSASVRDKLKLLGERENEIIRAWHPWQPHQLLSAYRTDFSCRTSSSAKHRDRLQGGTSKSAVWWQACCTLFLGIRPLNSAGRFFDSTNRSSTTVAAPSNAPPFR